ncbi:hypothetical protein PN498_19215 [Oscillatoria sp. CS-180]|uniref:hypothetical protein n=1 Tax=Oscillatoria sp. CS-180 TaxID=3021720 RepID=UPI00232D581A|nr:hypothetical protein [Oscillatoria sp. CS-180]MDB9528131.1 hypothetical protein [Oscillatoria sp. CS-180]
MTDSQELIVVSTFALSFPQLVKNLGGLCDVEFTAAIAICDENTAIVDWRLLVSSTVF